MTQSRNTLHDLLETLGELEFVDGELSADEARQLAATFRTRRLQYVKQARNPLSSQQSQRLQQLDYRLQIVAEGQGAAEAIRSEALQTLEAFNWPLPDGCRRAAFRDYRLLQLTSGFSKHPLPDFWIIGTPARNAIQCSKNQPFWHAPLSGAL